MNFTWTHIRWSWKEFGFIYKSTFILITRDPRLLIPNPTRRSFGPEPARVDPWRPLLTTNHFFVHFFSLLLFLHSPTNIFLVNSPTNTFCTHNKYFSFCTHKTFFFFLHPQHIFFLHPQQILFFATTANYNFLKPQFFFCTHNNIVFLHPQQYCFFAPTTILFFCTHNNIFFCTHNFFFHPQQKKIHPKKRFL